ncbi:MAG: arginine--tRNA ligase [Patescibacteria group bacterium]|nr:arginine--tRNA ligase [Patescibacteria group bacterium]
MIEEKINNLIKQGIESARDDGKITEFEISEILVEHPAQENFGDYSCAIAMKFAKIAKTNPMEIAKIIVDYLPKNNDFIKKIEIAKPGFINFFVSEQFLVEEVNKVIIQGHKYGSSDIGKNKTVIIDYSSPNIAKSFGIGHLRSTIIGQAIYNIYKFLGWKCIGDNYLGDWGTQFGKLIYQIKKDKILLKDLTIEKLEKLYVKFHKNAEKNLEIEQGARDWFKKLEQGDKEAKKIWQICVNISLKEFEKIYKLLDVKIDYCFAESFYLKMSREIIDEAIDKKLVVKSEGALIIKYPKNELPVAMLLKSDSATTYFARNLAQAKYRLEKYNPDLIVYEVGVDQTLFLKQLFSAVELFGWAKKEKFVHIAHGLVRWKDKKFSTRKGDTIHLEQVLNQAIVKAKKIIKNKNLSEKEKQKIAETVGIGAVKYNDLSQYHNIDIVFDWDKILNLKGNSCPYIQYTFTRCQSVLEKAKFRKAKKTKIIEFNQEENAILRTIYKFPEIIEKAGESFSPNLICNFVFDLSQKYNAFYDKHKIIKADTIEQKEFRIALTFATSQIIKNSLNLLGISTLKKM